MATAYGAKDLFKMVRSHVDARAVDAHIRKPFRYLLCGDPSLVATLRGLLLSGYADDVVPFDAAACLETIVPGRPLLTDPAEARAVIFLARPSDGGADLSVLAPLALPIFAVVIDPDAPPSVPPVPPTPGMVARYVVPAIDREALRGRLFPHLVQVSKGVEIAVGRRLPPMREAVAAKLTRDAANNALKVSIASALVDHVPVIGIVLGAFASAGDMVAITGIQLMLLMHIEAAYGKDPDLQRVWQILPVIGGGFGWRALARELSGFVPVAGIAIKGTIAYAGTIVVGESVAFFLQNGHHMNKLQASQLFDRAKADAMQFARDTVARFRKN